VDCRATDRLPCKRSACSTTSSRVFRLFVRSDLPGSGEEVARVHPSLLGRFFRHERSGDFFETRIEARGNISRSSWRCSSNNSWASLSLRCDNAIAHHVGEHGGDKLRCFVVAHGWSAAGGV
jgi:hypothetical protein